MRNKLKYTRKARSTLQILDRSMSPQTIRSLNRAARMGRLRKVINAK